MICRRRLHRLRTPKTLALLVVTVLLLGVLMTYKILNGHDTYSSQHSSSLPSMEKRKPRYKAAHPKHSLISDRNQLRTFLNRQFNSGLKVAGVREVISLLYPVTWKSAKEPDEVAIILKDKMLGLDLPSNMSCREINNYQILGTLGQSNRKFVEKLEEPEDSFDSFDSYNSGRARRRRKLMAIKSQASDIQTKIACMKQVYNADFCGPMGNYLLMREIFLLRFLQHPNLIRLLGYCLRGDQISMELHKKGLVMVMEAGIPLVLNSLSSFSWSRRLQMALDAASLMEYLQSSPLGSVGLPHIQLRDFVLINHKSLKLTDLDEALLGEKECTQNSDCYLQGTDVGVECQVGHCVGLNQRINLRVIGNYVLDPLLHPTPPEESTSVKEMMGRVRNLDVLPSELVNFLDAMAIKYPATESEAYQKLKDKAHKHFDRMRDQARDQARARDRDQDEDEDEDEDDDEETQRANKVGDKRSVVPWKAKHTLEENPQPENYLRLDSSNFPGQYDYPCSDSGVLWGCVMTFTSLEAAMDRCNSEDGCKSFVVFSSQPEEASKMTVVFKSHNTGSPRTNIGTTLFVKRKDFHSKQEQPADREEVDNNEIPSARREKMQKDGLEETRKQDPWVKEKEMQECVKHSRDNQMEALRTREKRLMAHMGLKGKLEKDWKRAVQSQSISSFTNVRPLSGQGTQGGSVLIVYNTSSPGHTITRAKFLVEEGSRQNHVAFALVYQIDRLLGLYHTPPTVAGFMAPVILEKFSTNRSWHSTFDSLKHSDGTLRGLYVAPIPKVMKRSELLLKPLDKMVSHVTTFDRTERMQLEYVLLWWLGHISKPSNLHRGFKGHLIHVDGDQGFQEPAVNYEGYFNHCQFPNVVYKMLMCFRCRQGNTNNICHLGQEVVRRLEAAGFRLSKLHIENLAEEDYPALINGAASKTVEIVDNCIQEFGRETVLY